MNSRPLTTSILALVLVAASACTDPKETTGVGAAAGGAIGAGLGAIIGSQTGSAGGGLAIGAVAGAAGGALIGNSIQAQQESIQTQDEAIERQERTIAAQRRELQELKSVRGDDNSGQGPRAARTSGFDSLGANEGPRAVREPLAMYGGNNPHRPSLGERDLSAPITEPSISDHRRSSPRPELLKEAPNTTAPSSLMLPEEASEDCTRADVEMVSARKASESSDKLFHIRRALRLCPSEANNHYELAKVYKKLGRSEDAAFELKEALRLNPDHVGALDMSRTASKRY